MVQQFLIIINDYVIYNVNEAPEFILPDDVDIEKVKETIINMPLIPGNIRKQLKNIKNLEESILIPTFEFEDGLENVSINSDKMRIDGIDVYLSELKSGNEKIRNVLMWFDNGYLYQISANISNGNIIEMAKSIIKKVK